MFTRDNTWVNARDWFATRPAPPIVLDWRPAFVVVAQSGDLGLSTGPWKLTSRERPADPPATGEFASVWQRQSGGEWRVIVDIGILHKDPARWEAALRTGSVRAGDVRPAAGFVESEARFAAESSAKGLRAAYGAHASSAMHLLRQGAAPVVGRDAVLASPALGNDRIDWIVEHGATSLAGDLAFARGHYVAAAAPARPLGAFMRVWQVERGEWRILLDVTNPR
jgi:hypothetical protein